MSLTPNKDYEKRLKDTVKSFEAKQELNAFQGKGKTITPYSTSKLSQQVSPVREQTIGIPTARQQLMSQPAKWYKGDKPTASEIDARIYMIGQQDKAKAETLWNAWQGMKQDKSSPYYQPYTSATNTAIQELSNLGFDMSGGVTQQWIDDNAWLKNYYRLGTSGTPLSPSSSSSAVEDAAYWYSKILDAESMTQAAELEAKALRDEIAYWTNRDDLHLDNQEILDMIDWNNYKTLTQLYGYRNNEHDGLPYTLNRAIDYDPDMLDGMIWAARNGSTGNSAIDSVHAVLGDGKGYTDDPELRERRKTAPYTVGSTANDAAIYFGVKEFSDQWFEDNKDKQYSNDETERKMYAKAWEANENTKEAEEELQDLLAEVDRYKKDASGETPEEFLDNILVDYPMLKKLNNSLKPNKDLIPTTRAIDFNMADIQADVEGWYQQQQEKASHSFVDLISDAFSGYGEKARMIGQGLYNMGKQGWEAYQESQKQDNFGQYGKGNIDLNNRIAVDNGDGTFSTEDSITVNIDGKEVLLPTIIDGKKVSDDEAIKHYEETGEYLGKFDTPDEAEEYAQALHERQEKVYGQEEKPTVKMPEGVSGPINPNFTPDQGTYKPHSLSNVEQSIRNEKNKVAASSASVIMDKGTDADKTVWKTGSVDFKGTVIGLGQVMASASMSDAVAGAKGSADRRAYDGYLDVAPAVKEYEDVKAKADATQAEIDRLTAQMNGEMSIEDQMALMDKMDALRAQQEGLNTRLKELEPEYLKSMPQYTQMVEDQDAAEWTISNGAKALRKNIKAPEAVTGEDLKYEAEMKWVREYENGNLFRDIKYSKGMELMDQIDTLEAEKQVLESKQSPWLETDKKIRELVNGFSTSANPDDDWTTDDQWSEEIYPAILEFAEQRGLTEEQVDEAMNAYMEQNNAYLKFDLLNNPDLAEIKWNQFESILIGDKEIPASGLTPEEETRLNEINNNLAALDYELELTGADDLGEAEKERYEKEFQRYLSYAKDNGRTSTLASMNSIYEYGRYDPTDWSSNTKYDRLRDESYDASQIQGQAVSDIRDIERELTMVYRDLAEIDSHGINAGEYGTNLRRRAEKLERDKKQASYELLSYRDDFKQVVEEERKKGADVDVFISQHELDIYYYIRHTEGEEAAREYHDFLTDPTYGILTVRASEALRKDTQELSEKFPVLMTGVSVITSPLEMGGTLYALYAKLTDQEISPAHPAFAFSTMKQTVRSTVSEGMPYIGQILYNGGTSALDSAWNGFLFGGLTSGAPTEACSRSVAFFKDVMTGFAHASPMGIEAASSAIMNAKIKGASDDQAMLMGLITFACETGTEAITLNNMMDFARIGSGKEAKSLVGQFLHSYAEEVFGEEINEILEYVGDNEVMGMIGDRQKAIDKYKTEYKMTDEQATLMADKEFLNTLLETALTTMISTGITDSISYAKGRVEQRVQTIQQYEDAGISHGIARQLYNAELQNQKQQKKDQREFDKAYKEIQARDKKAEGISGETTVPVQTETTAEPAVETTVEPVENTTEQATKDVALLTASIDARNTDVAASIAAVLGGQQATNSATATAQELVSRIGGDAAANLVRSTRMVAEASGKKLSEINSAIQVAVNGMGKAAQVLDEMVKNGVTSEGVASLVDAAAADMQNQTTVDMMNKNIQDNRVSNNMYQRAGNGELDKTNKARAKVKEAQTAVNNAQADLDDQREKLTALGESMTRAMEEWVQNPQDQDAEAQKTKAVEAFNGQNEVVKEREQTLANAQKNLETTQKEAGNVSGEELTTVREESTADIVAEDQALAEAEEQQRQEEARKAEEAAKAKVEEDKRSGKAEEDRVNNVIEDLLNQEHLEGEERDKRRQQLKEQAEKIKHGKIDMTGLVNNTEGYLAISMLGRRLGLNFKLSDTLGNARGMYENGTVYLNHNLIKQGKITIGQALVEASLHEITHSMENAGVYNHYRDTVLKYLYGGDDTLEIKDKDGKVIGTINGIDLAKYNAALKNKKIVYKNNVNQDLTDEGAMKEIVADFARTKLSGRDVVERFLDNGLGGKMRNALHNINQTLKNFRLKGNEKVTAEYLRRAERAFQKGLDQIAKTAIHPEGGQFSVAQIAQATGMQFDAEKQELYKTDSNGNRVVITEVTPEMLEKTPVGMLIDNGLTGEQNKKAKEMFAGLMSMIAKYRQSDLIWEIGATTLSSTFSALKSNSDPQYKNTVDFGTVCAKTQSIVNVMSKVMMRKIDPNTHMLKEGAKRGLTRDDIMDVYNEVHKAGLSVPCPVCYVFSRWMGVPSLLGQMSQYQHDLVVTEKDENGNTKYDKNGDAIIDKEATQKKANDYIKEALKKYGDKDGITDALYKLRNKLSTLEKKENALRKSLYDPSLTADQKNDIRDQIKGLLSDMTDVEKKMGEVSAYNWVTQALCKQKKIGKKTVDVLDKNGNHVLDEKFKLTPDDILFDLNRTGEFAGYAKNWQYRNTRGAGMGKAIMPYSGETIGDILYGDKGSRQSNISNPWLNMLPAQAKQQLRYARERAAKQNLVGGQRLQSTSDFRPEWGLDYIMTFLELQAAKSNVQMYTKVAEAVDFFASVGADVNLSIMGKGQGWHQDENGNYVLDFSDITGMNYKTALDLKNKYDNVQMILVGMNDRHIRLAIANSDIDFVIPWHSSGNSKEILASLISAVGEKLNASVDYTRTQADMFKGESRSYRDENGVKIEYTAPGERTQEEISRWNARMKILTGKADNTVAKGGLTEEERAMVNADTKWLGNLYNRFYVKGVDANCYGIKLSGDQAKQIFPYEYWDTSVKKEDADINGKRFVEYCESMGIVPRFSQFKDDPGYWKLLIDRPMYDNKGNYRSQQVIDVTKARIGNLDETGKLVNSDLPSQAQAKYAPNDPRNPHYEEYIAAENTAEQNANALLERKYDTDGQYSMYGDITDADMEQMLSQANEDYQDAVNRGDMEAAQEDVDFAAQQAGYTTPKLYHGTQGFGFTEFDLTLGENLIFATADRDLAQTYSGFTPRSRIKDRTISYDLHGQALLDQAKKEMKGYDGYSIMPDDAKAAEIADTRDTIGNYAERIDEFIADNDGAFNEEKMDALDRMNKGIVKLSNAKNMDERYAAWDEFSNAIGDLEAIDYSIYDELSKQTGLDNISYAITKLDVLLHDGILYWDEQQGNYSPILTEEKLKSRLKSVAGRGVYELYGKPGNQLVIDAENGYWNKITPPDELGLDGPRTTRQIALAAKEKGYDSVVIQNLRDSGGQTGYNAPSDVYIFFDPNQVKSADPVTYDGEGNVIPLDQRFTEDNDIRYSAGGEMTTADLEQMLSQTNEDYMDAVNRGDMEAARQDVGSYAEAKGYTEIWEHGTPNATFTSFDLSKAKGAKAVFLSDPSTASEYAGTTYRRVNTRLIGGEVTTVDDALEELKRINPEFKNVKEVDGGYSIPSSQILRNGLPYKAVYSDSDLIDAANKIREKNKGGVYSLLVNPGKMLKVDAQGAWWDRINSEYGRTTDQIGEWARRNGYDSVEIDNVHDGGFNDAIPSDILLVFDGNRLKSTETVTYDDAGNVIPLSERFNLQNQDIRYSAGGDLTTADIDQQLINSGAITQEELDAYYGPSQTLPGPALPTDNGSAQRQFGYVKAQQSDALHQEVKDYLYTHSNYTPDSNSAQIDRAFDWVQSHANDTDTDGYFGAVREVESPNYDYRSADGQARMLTLMGMAALKGDIATEVRLADAYNKQGTDIGRMLQARKLFRMMTPLGRQAILQKMADDINNEYGRKGSNRRVALSDWTMLAAAEAQTEEDFAKVQQQAAKEIADQMPANWKEKLVGWRMLSMLGNPRTHIRNWLGNALFMPVVGIKNKVAALGEIIDPRVKQGQRTKTMGFANPEARAFAKQDVKTVRDDLTGEAKYKDGNAVQSNRKIWGTGKGPISRTLGKALQAVSDFNGDALEFEDWIFLKRHYKNAMAGYMTANKLKASDMTGDTLEKARIYAIQEAQKATYRDANKLAEDLNNVKNPVLKFGVNAALPFKKTPANIMRRGIEYSPVGFLDSLFVDGRHMKQYLDYQNGKLSVLPEKAISPAQWIDKVASGLTGTGIMALGTLLASLGVVSGGMDDDDDEFDKLRGKQKYGLNVKLFGHDVSATIDWAAPMSMPFFVGASIYEVAENLANGEDVDALALAESLLNISEPVFNLSMLDGVNSLLDFSSYDEGNAIEQLGEKLLLNYATSYVPTAVGQLARTIDTTRRKSYVESGKKPSQLWYALEKLENKIPWLSMTNIPYRDVWGNTDESPTWGAGLENFLSPAYINEIKQDDVVDELERLFDATKDKIAIPKTAAKTIGDLKLNAEQYDQLVLERGQKAHSMLEELFASPEYQLADNATKLQMVDLAWSYADKTSKADIKPGYPLENWMSQGVSDPVQAVIDRATEKNKTAYQTGYKKALTQSINDGDLEGARTSVQALKDSGMTEEKIKEYLGNQYRDLYKEAYLDGDRETMIEIKNMLLDLDVGFTKKLFDKWQKDAEK